MPFNVEEYTKGIWLKGGDLEEGERTVVTIKSAEEYTFNDGSKQPVLEFLEVEQKLSLNKTRIKKLVELLGEDTGTWVGQKVALYAVPTQYNGQVYSSVAVAAAPRAKQSSPKRDVKFEAGDDEEGATPFN